MAAILKIRHNVITVSVIVQKIVTSLHNYMNITDDKKFKMETESSIRLFSKCESGNISVMD